MNTRTYTNNAASTKKSMMWVIPAVLVAAIIAYTAYTSAVDKDASDSTNGMTATDVSPADMPASNRTNGTDTQQQR